MNPTIDHLIERNRNWSQAMRVRDPEFFARLAKQQTPEYLWIGCADSRVPANEIIGMAPGEVFVHRNVANVVLHTDLNCLSVLQYAVDVLRVKHVLVVGHYGCGGVRAALQGLRLGLIDNWLRHVQDIRDQHRAAFERLVHVEARADRLCELNVLEQVRHVCETTVVLDAWQRGQPLSVHGWVYGLRDGLVRDLAISIANEADALPRYVAAVDALLRG